MRWTVLGVVGMAQFLVLLDSTVANVALPTIAATLPLGPALAPWVIDAYTLTFGALLLVGGRLADGLGHRRVFVLGVVVFTAASAACTAAPGGTVLVTARAVQGLGAAALSPAALAVLTRTYRERHARSVALGVWAALGGLGATVGVVVGGLAVFVLGWRSVFALNVPVGIAVVLLAARMVPADAVGAVRGPLVPRALLASRALRIAGTGQLLLGATQLATLYLLSIEAQVQLHLSPLAAGGAFVPVGIAAVLAALVSSRLATRIGLLPVWITALTMAAAGLAGLALLDGHGGYGITMLGPALLVGTSLPASSYAATTLGTGAVDTALSGSASGILTAGFQVGGALGVAAAAAAATVGITVAFAVVAVFPLLALTNLARLPHPFASPPRQLVP